ncbi:MAG: MlaD family protein [Actinomycetota bacterium]
MRGGRVQSLAASPTMVGAITTLIVIVAVFLAYNASNGLPFVPVYRVSVVLPNAARLAPNNEVRIGGSRVGVVESITPDTNDETGKAAAKLNLKLDKTVDPLPQDTQVRVRYKSSFGLKYLELIRGTGEPLSQGGTIPVTQASSQTEFDDIANTFDTPTREASRVVLEGFGNAFAARGASLNEAIQNLDPLFTNLKPVARILISPNTRLKRFFPALARTAQVVAPVAEQQAELFTNMAITFGALSADTQALKDTISTGVPTLEQGTVALRHQTPFLRDFTDLSARLRPGVADLRVALPTFNDALAVGAPLLARTPPINAELGRVFTELEKLVKQPQTKTTLLRLRETFRQAAPAAKAIAPVQTVCNYWNYWFTYLPEHLTQPDGSTGFTQRVSIIGVPSGSNPPEAAETPIGGYSGLSANGKAAAAPSNPNNREFQPHEFPILHGTVYGPAIDASTGKADCQSAQAGYALGQLLAPGQQADTPAIAVRNLPGLRGPTFHGRSKLPSKSLQPVPIEELTGG